MTTSNQSTDPCFDERPFCVAPHPRLKRKMLEAMETLELNTRHSVLANKIRIKQVHRPGFNDGLIYPGTSFPLGTPAVVARSARLNKVPLSGIVRIIVVLVDFPDKPMTKTKKHFEDLFFSSGIVPTGSVYEYYKEVSGGLIDIHGEVAGPFRLPKTLAKYANGESGIGSKLPNARTMAKDSFIKSRSKIDFSKYDNDGDNFVDAFIIVHAGTGAETNNNPGDIWSHKWLLEGDPMSDGTTKVYAYLTVPEDCTIGVCAHELGHLLFGFPDLYDEDYTSNGIGDWCLMSGGSWCNEGRTPTHPSAWCKAAQGWVSTITPTSNLKDVSIKDVKTDKKIYKLWKDGVAGKEYFLVENRQKKKFDKFLPGSGLLIWHIDDTIEENSNEAHYRVALKQADGLKDLELGENSGDHADSFPGSGQKKKFNAATNPNSKSYAGINSMVRISNIKMVRGVIKADISIK